MINKVKFFLRGRSNSLRGYLFGLSSNSELLRRERRTIFFLIFSLTLVGLLFIYESSSLYALKYQNNPAYFFKKQILFFILSLFFFYGSLFIDLNFLRQQSKKILLFLIIVLIIVPFFGQKSGGASRWVELGGFSFQPSELLKIFFLIYCADYCSRKERILKNLNYGFIPVGLVLTLICLLLLAQPDLGSVVFWIIWFLIFVYLYGAKLKHIAIIVSGCLVSFFFLVKMYPYRVRRIAAYLDPFSDPQGSGFQIIQSQLAYSRGGLFGVGLGEGKQKLFFLPAAHTDFIFSIIAEELGLILSLGIVSIFFLIIHKMFKISKFINDKFRKGILFGIAIIFFLEVFINIGVTCGLLPTKGMSLPFISYGGTNLVVHYILLGLFFNASKEPFRNKVN
ncbi:MAG: putative lipid II flippase FtsW [Candidatus Omnitrophica bacterium]|nr:putative lipid II flippase FtsW [Candidatus Omnitrophota bacterium]MCF7893590.1 putative lipid II flippase FtsW [Candidatus Omnitrophota bacterium]